LEVAVSRKVPLSCRLAKPLAIGALSLLVMTGVAVPSPALADPPGPAVKKLGNRVAIQVDNGWVIYQAGKKDNPIFYNSDANPDFQQSTVKKLKTPGASATDSYFAANGIVFAPCPNGQDLCQPSWGGTVDGVGLGFGQYLLKAGDKSQGGWISDDGISAHRTNALLLPGSIAALAVGTSGAFGVGEDTAPSGFTEAVVVELDSTGQTYAPVGTAFLGTLGGNKSFATNISKNAIYITGSAQNAKGKYRAVYAHPGDTSWTDLGDKIPDTLFGGKVVRSQALAANDDGIIAGTATIKIDVAGRTNYPVDVGFVFDIAHDTMSFYSAPGATVIPLKVLPGPDVKVVGNLEFVKDVNALKSYSAAVHPFMYDGSTVTDFFSIATGPFQFYFGCQAGIPNNLGEVAGTCIADQFTSYTKDTPTTVPFYLNMLGGAPTFVDLNIAIHTSQDALVPGIVPYHLGQATSIDDQGEVTLVGNNFGKAAATSFLATKAAYSGP
jgi:hypothetical protein